MRRLEATPAPVQWIDCGCKCSEKNSFKIAEGHELIKDCLSDFIDFFTSSPLQ